MRVSEIMTRSVIGVSPTASLAQAASLMLDARISGLPVVDSKQALLGIITESDFLRRRELSTTKKRPRWLQFMVSPGKAAEEYAHSNGRTVSEVMSANVVTVAPEASLEQVVDVMSKHRIKRIPVLSGSRLVGIVSRTDLMRAFLKMLADSDPAVQNDSAIRNAINSELEHQNWAHGIRISVADGIVELKGIVTDEREKEAARIVAENVHGVTKVVDLVELVDLTFGVYGFYPGAVP